MSIYQSNRYPIWRALIGSFNSRLVDFEADVKMTGSARAKIEKSFTLYCFFEKKVHFNPIILVNSKTTTPLRVNA